MREIVIKLPEKVINRILEYKEMPYTDLVIEAIYHGILLPKGHGSLKDVDHYIKMQWKHPDYSLMDDEPTIIEANKTESEGEE